MPKGVYCVPYLVAPLLTVFANTACRTRLHRDAIARLDMLHLLANFIESCER